MAVASGTQSVGSDGSPNVLADLETAAQTASKRKWRIGWLAVTIFLVQVVQYGFDHHWRFVSWVPHWRPSTGLVFNPDFVADWLKLLLLVIESFVTAAVASITLTYVSVVNNNTVNEVTQHVQQIWNRIVNQATPPPGTPISVDPATRDMLVQLIREARDSRVGAEVQQRLDGLISELESTKNELRVADHFFEGLNALLEEVKRLRSDLGDR